MLLLRYMHMFDTLVVSAIPDFAPAVGRHPSFSISGAAIYAS